MSKNGRLIYELVCSCREHLTAEEIFLRVKVSSPSIVMATVYNNLNRLVQEGKLRRLCVEGSADRYDNVTRHDHITCISCGKMSDVRLDDFTQLLREKTGVDVLSYDLNARYLCRECQNQAKN